MNIMRIFKGKGFCMWKPYKEVYGEKKGNCELPFLEKGMKVRIPKGTPIWTTLASKEKKLAGKNQTVNIHDIFKGYICSGYPERNPEISWAGTGGYWHHVDVNNIEIWVEESHESL